jgi:hypothetical protein
LTPLQEEVELPVEVLQPLKQPLVLLEEPLPLVVTSVELHVNVVSVDSTMVLTHSSPLALLEAVLPQDRLLPLREPLSLLGEPLLPELAELVASQVDSVLAHQSVSPLSVAVELDVVTESQMASSTTEAVVSSVVLAVPSSVPASVDKALMDVVPTLSTTWVRLVASMRAAKLT